jgi:hypothetical protein
MPNVVCVSGLFLFCLSSLLSVLCPLSPVSLDCFCFVGLRCWVFYAQCRLCLWIVFVLFVFAVECLCPMSPVSLDCFCFVWLSCWVFYAECHVCPWIVFVLFVFAVECFMPNVACVPGLLFLFSLTFICYVCDLYLKRIYTTQYTCIHPIINSYKN